MGFPRPAYNRTHKALIKPHDFASSYLASDLADSFLEIYREIPGSALKVLDAIRDFVRWYGQAVGEDRARLADVTTDHLRAWERDLKRRQQQTRTHTFYDRFVLF